MWYGVVWHWYEKENPIGWNNNSNNGDKHQSISPEREREKDELEKKKDMEMGVDLRSSFTAIEMFVVVLCFWWKGVVSRRVGAKGNVFVFETSF